MRHNDGARGAAAHQPLHQLFKRFAHAVHEHRARFPAGRGGLRTAFHPLGKMRVFLCQLFRRFSLPFAEITLAQAVQHNGLHAGIEHVQRLAAAQQRAGEVCFCRGIAAFGAQVQQSLFAFLREGHVRGADVLAPQVSLRDAVADEMNEIGLHQF